MIIEPPRKPFLIEGKIQPEHWEVPLEWCVDFNKVCWVSRADGLHQYACSKEHLFQCISKYIAPHVRLEILIALDPPEEPWMAPARKAGWRPFE